MHRVKPDWQKFQTFWRKHKNRDIVVCGLGPSIEGWAPPEGVLTIGVNDIGKHFTPDYMLCIDHPGVFKKWLPEPRLQTIMDTKPRYAFFVPNTLYPTWRKKRQDITQFMIGGMNKNVAWRGDWHVYGQPQIHHCTGGSPLPAASIAGFLGAKRIGLLGVDLYSHHAFKDNLQDSKHVWRLMREFLERNGVEIWNLSKDSALRTIPFMDLEEFLCSTKVS